MIQISIQNLKGFTRILQNSLVYLIKYDGIQ